MACTFVQFTGQEVRNLIKELVHRLGGVLAHVLEDVGVPSEGHRRVGVAEHPGNRVERDALPQGQSAGGVTQVVEADLYREAGLLKEESVGNVIAIRTIQGTPPGRTSQGRRHRALLRRRGDRQRSEEKASKFYENLLLMPAINNALYYYIGGC